MFKKIYVKIFKEFFENMLVLMAIIKISFKKKHGEECSSSKISTIVFSKDRPIQLEALLESYYYYFKGPTPVTIIYNAKDQAYERAYQELFKNHAEKISLIFDDSKGFKEVLLKALYKIKTKKIFFLVDDIVFKNFFDPSKFLNLGDEYIPSLRMGKHLTRSYTLSKIQPVPELKEENGLYIWDYAKGQHDWGYPLSVDGHFFETLDIIKMTEVLKFKAPNSYESKLQKFGFFFNKKKGACEEVSSIVNIPCNKVQTENENEFGNLHQDELLKIGKDKKINFRVFEGIKNESCHQDLELQFIGRD